MSFVCGDIVKDDRVKLSAKLWTWPYFHIAHLLQSDMTRILAKVRVRSNLVVWLVFVDIPHTKLMRSSRCIPFAVTFARLDARLNIQMVAVGGDTCGRRARYIPRASHLHRASAG